MDERRSGQDRRCPPGTCRNCRHAASDHVEGTKECTVCFCTAYIDPALPVVKVKPKPDRRKVAVKRKKAR